MLLSLCSVCGWLGLGLHSCGLHYSVGQGVTPWPAAPFSSGWAVRGWSGSCLLRAVSTSCSYLKSNHFLFLLFCPVLLKAWGTPFQVTADSDDFAALALPFFCCGCHVVLPPAGFSCSLCCLSCFPLERISLLPLTAGFAGAVQCLLACSCLCGCTQPLDFTITKDGPLGGEPGTRQVQGHLTAAGGSLEGG